MTSLLADGASEYWLLMADGASRGNPGRAGAGAVLRDPEDRLLAEISLYLGDQVTNNEAEYQALIEGLKEALKLGAKKLKIRMDSELVVRQLQGVYKVRNERLQLKYQEVLGFLKQLDGYNVAHVRREQNSQADALATAAAQRGPKRIFE